MAAAEQNKYDLAYIWDSNLENVLDYEAQLTELLTADESRRLRIVGRKGGEYGLVYDFDGPALESAKLMVSHSEILRKAGLPECTAVEDKGYFRLFNVSYGLGPNIDALKKLYDKIYNYLGEEVGKNLYIEKTDSNNYTLIYRRRGDRGSTYAVARAHARLLKKRGIRTSITPENNNPVLFGESSHLDDQTGPAETDVVDIGSEATDLQVQASLPDEKVDQNPELPDKQVVHSSGQYSEVEKNIEEYIQSLRKQGKLSSDETTGWMVYDLTRGQSVVDINADQVFQAASMIKPFVALAFFHKVQQGKIMYGPKSRRNMERMIQHSNNGATNWVMRIVGGPSECEKILLENYGEIFKNTRIVEYIPAGGKTYRNKAVPSDYVRFLQALWNDELPYGKEMRRLMSLPGRDRLYDGTPIPRGTLVYNKTGSTAHLCGDMGILVPKDGKGRRYPYALVGIIERSSRPANYGNWMLSRGNVIRQVSTIVYQEMKKQYKLL